jgi:hypothetical protein
MNLFRSAASGLAALVLAGLFLAACGTSNLGTGTPPATVASPSLPPPKDAFLASLKALSQTSSDLMLKQGEGSGTAKVDPATKSAAVSMSGVVEGTNIKIDLIAIDPDVWLKLDFGAAGNRQLRINPTKWMKIDKAKVTSDTAFPIDLKSSSDVLDLPDLFVGLGEVQRTDSTHYSGTVDLTKAGGVSALSQDDLKKLGDKASSTPFTAVLDGQGRLMSFKIDTTAVDATLTTELTVNSYGSAATITKPAAADVVPAPAALYQLLNS